MNASALTRPGRSLTPASRRMLPLLDRDRELSQLREILGRGLAGETAAVLISGEPGVGKSTLIDTLLQDGGLESAWLLTARCYEQEVEYPYAVWFSLLDSQPDLAQHLPEPLGRRTPAATGPIELARFTADGLQQAAESRPLVLVIDDAQWTDTRSIELVRAVLQRTENIPAFFLLSYREHAAEGSAFSSQLSKLVGGVRPHMIRLKPISSSVIRSFADDRYGNLPADERRTVADKLANLSGGNALFLSELIDVLDDATDAVSASEALSSVPPSLQQAIQVRLTNLPPEVVNTLQFAALIGESFDPSLLAAIAPQADGDIWEALDVALERGVIVMQDEQLRFRHGIVHRVLYDGQSALRRRPQHATILDHLRTMPSAAPVDIARHAELAHDYATAIDALETAARRATRMFAMPEAASLYQRAIVLAERANISAARQDELRLTYSDSVIRNDRELAFKEVRRVIERALMRDDKLILAMANQRLAVLLYESGRRAEAIDILDETIPELERAGDRSALLDALACYSMCALSESDFARADKATSRLGELADEIDHPIYRAVALLYRAIMHVARGMPDGAPERGRESAAILAAAGKFDLATPHTAMTFMRVDLFANLHRPRMVADLAAWAEELDREGSQRLGLEPRGCDCFAEFAYWWFLRGDWDRAREVLPDPLELRGRDEPQVLKDNVHTIAAELAAATGDRDQAIRLLRYIAPSPDHPLGEHSYQQWLMAACALGVLSIETGDFEQAKAWIAAVDAALEAKPHEPGELLYLTLCGSLALALGELRSAIEILVGVVQRAEQTSNMLALIRAARALARAYEGLGEEAEAMRAIERACRAANLCELGFESATCELTGAGILARGSAPSPDLAAELAKLKRYFEGLGASAPVREIEALERQLNRGYRPGGLTPRERDVLALIVEGLTDNEIAGRLFISPRTVGTHISNMLNKTTTNNRVELATWAIANDVVSTDRHRR